MVVVSTIITSFEFKTVSIESSVLSLKYEMTSYINAFFYKNKLYKNTRAEICPKIRNKLRTITRLKF